MLRSGLSSKQVKPINMQCYCGSAKEFSLCCLPLISGQAKAEHCEQLMRSRYSAYCHRNIHYLHQTYHPSKQAANSLASLAVFADSSHFIKLTILSSEQTATEGYVSFSVRYIQQSTLYEFTERSRFVYDKAWYYIDGILDDKAPVKIGRNELCPCGSAKKLKHCVVHRLSGN
jgi:SEC-C motif-containing protein